MTRTSGLLMYALSTVSSNGENIVHTLAANAPTAVPQAVFVTLITALKNMCGISFGAILRHPRCSEVHRDKISREAIDK